VSVETFVEDWTCWPGRTSPSWFAGARSAAIERFRALGIPTARLEDWHFTNAAPIGDRPFPAIDPAGVGPVPRHAAEEIDPFTFGAADWTQLVFVNGHFAPGLSTDGLLPAGATVTLLDDALTEEGGPARVLAERYLGTVAPAGEHAFTALNTAFCRSGAVIHIPAAAEVAHPIHLLYVSDEGADGGATYPRTLVVLDRHARATVVESYVALGDAASFTDAVTEIVLQEGAALTHIRVQRESARALHVGTAQTTQARDSRYVSFSFATGGALSRQNIYTALAGAGAEAILNGLYMADGTQHIDHQTRIEHIAPNCASHEVYKGVLDGSSHGVFNGKVYVHPEAQKTDGKQTNNNLLLSADARIDTKPQLEIFADDVKCTHGATVGRLDEVALFYLKSRGIGAREARTLLTYAFAADVLEGIESDPIRTGLQGLARERFVDLPEFAGR
jgi:Fe-S cluster assembly protein SufD